MEKITWQDYLKAIAGPYERAFTLENTLKAFEVTGTWPVDRSKITNDMTALAEGLSTQSGPAVNLSSPVKCVVDFLQSERALPTSSLAITSVQAWESSAGSPNMRAIPHLHLTHSLQNSSKQGQLDCSVVPLLPPPAPSHHSNSQN